MQVLRRFVQMQFFNILVLMLAGGFAILLAELLLTEHTDGIQLVAVGASVTGLLLTLTALVVRNRTATVVAILLLLLSATGMIGAVEHFEAAQERNAEVQRAETAPPPLAPLSLTGLSILGAMTVLGAPRKESSVKLP